MSLTDSQLLDVIVTIVCSAVGATAWITWRLSAHHTEIKNLKDNLKKTDDLIMYMLKLDYEEGRKVAADLRRVLPSKKE